MYLQWIAADTFPAWFAFGWRMRETRGHYALIERDLIEDEEEDHDDS